ncbi:MAG TPA: DUF2520 domain-containing protein [Paludibacteraceae bacterium]|nr:DUF2520 domain-containing protein [Bacteroidales bacterium]HQP79982.1 DUF2520 domain-containing protein [Paludibacteraceae bacterium]
MPHKNQHIVLIGAGNLATQLGLALYEQGYSIVQVYSRTIAAAQTLASQIKATATDNLAQLMPTANLYIYAIKDDALPEVINKVTIDYGIHVHTSGSVPMAVFEKKRTNFGVFYPLQTFKKEKRVDFQQIPIFLEASNKQTFDNLNDITKTISENVHNSTSEDRQTLHLSAVFACNFTNHFYAIAGEVLKSTNLPFAVLLPLIREGVNKLETLTPKEAQTGPAVRNDQNIINNHLKLLKAYPEWQEIYQQITKNIQNYHNTKNE